MNHWIRKIIFSFLVLSPQISALIRVNKGVHLDFNRSGLDYIAQLVKDQFLSKIENISLPKIEKDLGSNTRITAEGATFSVVMDRFDINPHEGNQVSFDAKVKNIEIKIPSLHIYKKILFELHSECKNIRINIATERSLPMEALLGAKVVDTLFQLSTEKILFDIPREDFKVEGPDDCSGPPLIDRLIEHIVHSTLESAHSTIADAIRKQVLDTKPWIEKMLNSLSHYQFRMDTVLFPGMPAIKGTVFFYPFDVTTSLDGVFFNFDCEAKSLSEQRKKNLVYTSLTSILPTLGTLGLKPEVLSEIIDQLIVKKSMALELTDDLVPVLSSLVNRPSLEAVWPDLRDNPGIISDTMKVFLSLSQSPKFKMNPDETSLLVSLNEIQLTFKTLTPLGWKEYYTVLVSFDSKIEIKQKEGVLFFNLNEAVRMTITGRWGKKPNLDVANLDYFTHLFDALISYLTENRDILKLNLPTVEVLNQKIYVDHHSLSPEYLDLSLSAESK